MRIRAIHTYEFGALGTQSFDFRDSWSDETATRILLSGAMAAENLRCYVALPCCGVFRLLAAQTSTYIS